MSEDTQRGSKARVLDIRELIRQAESELTLLVYGSAEWKELLRWAKAVGFRDYRPAAPGGVIECDAGIVVAPGEDCESYIRLARRHAARVWRDRVFAEAADVAMADSRLPTPPEKTNEPERDLTDALVRWCIDAIRALEPARLGRHEHAEAPANSKPPQELPELVRRFLVYLERRPDRTTPVRDIPAEFRTADLIDYCDREGFTEVGRRKHVYLGPERELRVEDGWEWGAITGPNKKPISDSFFADKEKDPRAIQLHIRLTEKGRGELARTRFWGADLVTADEIVPVVLEIVGEQDRLVPTMRDAAVADLRKTGPMTGEEKCIEAHPQMATWLLEPMIRHYPPRGVSVQDTAYYVEEKLHDLGKRAVEGGIKEAIRMAEKAGRIVRQRERWVHDRRDEDGLSVTGEMMQEGDVYVLASPAAETPAISATQSGASAAPATTASAAAVNEDSHLSHSKLAQIFGLPKDALRTRLNRWRAKNDAGWIENPDRRPREAKYLYRVGSVRPVIDALRATS